MPKLSDGNLGSAEVAERYKVSAQRARQILYEIREAGFLVETISRRLIIRESVLAAWEKKTGAAGRALPGIKPRGPKARGAEPVPGVVAAAKARARKSTQRRFRFSGDAMTGPHDTPKL